ncbi:uncharacterized protein LOC116297123 [Actinia tenebrosa]|uniref:Uncharacterized protein LOC116297123 n=1 Tax=Actinia tenebrosa TaxID=6105 RepID=A0A6P8I920_ACTTE|nr:uncharacterized protein LOC116297123 [Actinia tenebrosa]
MIKMILISILALLHSSTIASAQKMCSGFDFTRHIDYRLECGIFRTLVADQIKCQKTCVDTLRCFSVNVYRLENGTNICELIRKSKDSRRESACFVKKYGTEHNELVTSRNNCPSQTNSCHFDQQRKALPDDWYQLGTTAYKLFFKPLPWHKASEACKSKGAKLVQIKNEGENRFIAETLLPDLRRPGTQLPDSMKPLAYWKLDGTDTNVQLFGDSKYKKDVDGKTTVLNLPATASSYGETPSFDIRSSSFTMAVWTNMNQGATYLYSRWGGGIEHFAYGFSDAKYILQFKDELGKKDFEKKIPAYYKRWTHYTAVWNRNTGTATLYVNANKLHEVKLTTGVDYSSASAAKANLPPLAPAFDIGYYRGVNYRMNGSLSQMYLFDRALESEEVEKIRDAAYMGNSAWIGLNDINTEGRYMIDDSRVASYINLAPGQIANDVQDCVSMRAWDEGRMDVNHCLYTALPYICMKQV